MALTAPVIAIAEAKNDNLRTGLGQCIAAMVAAREFNANAGTEVPVIHGVVTTDGREYFVAEVNRIMGILAHILTTA